MPFSTRYGNQGEEPQLEFASDKLKRRICLAFCDFEFGNMKYESFNSGIEVMMGKLGVLYDPPVSSVQQQTNRDKLIKYVTESSDWYTIYDLIEYYFSFLDPALFDDRRKTFNEILEEENSAYRILNNRVVPLMDEIEVTSLEETLNSKYETVNIHISKALNLLSNRKDPDYENSIKEAISAVESMCCIITDSTGKSATLTNAIKKLDEQHVHIHKAMEEAFIKLYGYTSDADGIRHGNIDFTNAPYEDAKFMLVACSAFVNYLIDKWETSKEE